MTAPVRIGVAAVLEAARWSFWDEDAALVPGSYHRALVRAGALDIPFVPDPRVTAEPGLLLDLVEGLLLIGGVDVDPDSYGGLAAATIEPTSRGRDDFELALLTLALEREMPFLGICRGMQVLNVVMGGTLVPDLGADGNAIHRPALGTFVGTEHQVRVAGGTLAAASVPGVEAPIVHSHHHQAIDRVGADLRVTATAADGTIEAIEVPGHPFALGVQWHPEGDVESRVIADFVAAARAATLSR